MTAVATTCGTEARRRGDLQRELRVAGRALSRAGLVSAFGHCSARLDQTTFLVTPSGPLGLLSRSAAMLMAPADGPLPVGAAPEVRLHQHVYRRRPDVGAVCRVVPPQVSALSAGRRTPRALHGPGAWFAPRAPLWDDPLLVRDDDRAAAIAARLDDGAAVVLRGNGAVVVGTNVREAVVLAWFLEEAARLELTVLGGGLDAIELTAAEARARATWSGGILDRAWAHLTAGDAEAI